MSRKSRTACKSCEKESVECDKLKPQCRNCTSRDIKCSYPLTLQWGGRPYKNKQKVLNIPMDTSLVNGVLKVKKKSVFLRHKGKNKSLVLINENLAWKNASLGIEGKDNSEWIANDGEDDGNTAAPYVLNNEIENLIDCSSYNENRDDLSGNIPVCDSICVENRDTRFSPEVFDCCPSSQVVKNQMRDYAPLTISLQMSTPALDFLKSSVEYWNLFDFYMNTTSHLLVLLSCEDSNSNPFRTVLPRMALHSTTLMKLLLAFSGQHRRQLRLASKVNAFKPLAEDLERVENEQLSRRLLDQSTTELIEKLDNEDERLSDVTLANILMLACYSLYICDNRNKWRTHFYGAKGIITRRLMSHGNQQDTVMYLTNDQGPYIFLQRWFVWMNIIGVLSSPSIATQSQSTTDLKFDFTSIRKKRSLSALRKEFDDIEYANGMEVEVLSLLAKISRLIVEKERVDTNSINPKLIADAIELDYEVLDYLETSEKERDLIWMQRQDEHKILLSDRRVQVYFLLRATNLIYGLTGVLQLRRRVVGMPHDCQLIKKLLLRISNLIDTRLSRNSSGLCCILFCLFCCGCELIDESLIPLRSIYIDRLESLEDSGVASATQAKLIMKECWATEKFWWDVMKETNLDLSFAM